MLSHSIASGLLLPNFNFIGPPHHDNQSITSTSLPREKKQWQGTFPSLMELKKLMMVLLTVNASINGYYTTHGSSSRVLTGPIRRFVYRENRVPYYQRLFQEGQKKHIRQWEQVGCLGYPLFHIAPPSATMLGMTRS